MYCPIQGYRKQYQNAVSCLENECALWDEIRKQCMIKTFIQAQTINLPTPQAQWREDNPQPSKLDDFATYLSNLNFE